MWNTSEIPPKQAVDEARFQIADSVYSIQKLVAGAVDKVEATDSAAWTYEALHLFRSFFAMIFWHLFAIYQAISNSLILNDCSQAKNWK